MSAQGRLILMVTTLAIVLPAPAAHAKGIAKASVCGSDGCATVTGRAQGTAGCTGCRAEQLMTVLPGSARPSRQAPYVRIVLGFGEPGGAVRGRERILYASELRLAARPDGRGGWAWFHPTSEALAVAQRMTRGIRPYPAASMPFERAAPAAPAEPAAPASSGDAGSLPILAGGAILVAALGLGAAAVRRRRRLA